ncbi:MAG TPA: hypothetical protein VGK06_15975 [Methanosarcina sp.]
MSPTQPTVHPPSYILLEDNFRRLTLELSHLEHAGINSSKSV